MQRVYNNPTEIEKTAKKAFGIPDFLMMENAAACMCDFILSLWQNKATEGGKVPKVLIVCGKGNNGGDGFALARKLQGKADVSLFCLEEPVTTSAGTTGTAGTSGTVSESAIQFEMCKRLGLSFIQKNELHQNIVSYNFIVDCLYGTGFRGELKPEAAELIKLLNAQTDCIRIACDIPTGLDIQGRLSTLSTGEKLCFNADYTISMGTQKLAFYSDEAKQACGKIIVADLGIAREKFETASEPSPVLLVEKDDVKLPVRKNKAAHKGTYGHTAVFAGNKSGAAIIAATAAMNFGSGLTTLVAGQDSNLSQFKISPELMISNTIPKKTTCVVLGPGTESLTEETACVIEEWFAGQEKASPAAVFDAGIVSSEDFILLLKKLTEKTKCCKQDSSGTKSPRIVLTPHLLEFSRFCRNVKAACSSGYFDNEAFNFTDEDFCVETLTKSPETKIKFCNEITRLFPGVVLVVKSANTFISICEKTYIVADGTQSLAKGGSGDVLAGLIGGLLAQGYNAKEAAITACEVHALAAASYGEEAFDLTPEKLIEKITDSPKKLSTYFCLPQVYHP